MSAVTKSFDRRYFINARWPQRGATNSTQHMRDVPQFSQQHMYVRGCEHVTSIRQRGYFHHVFGGRAPKGIGWKWQCESWGEQEWGVLLNLMSAKPEVALISPRNATSGDSWQVLIGNHSITGSIMHFLTFSSSSEQHIELKHCFTAILSHDREKAPQIETKNNSKILKMSTVKLQLGSDNVYKKMEQLELKWDFWKLCGASGKPTRSSKPPERA